MPWQAIKVTVIPLNYETNSQRFGTAISTLLGALQQLLHHKSVE